VTQAFQPALPAADGFAAEPAAPSPVAGAVDSRRVPGQNDPPTSQASVTASSETATPPAAAFPSTRHRLNETSGERPESAALPAVAAPASSPPEIGGAAGGPTVPVAAAAVAVASATPDATLPATQLVPTLVTLARSGDTNRLTVQLEPAELGRVQIRVERRKDGPTLVTLTADRPQTLNLLVRDKAELDRALDQAGVPVEGRSIAFRLGAADGPASANTATPPAAPPPATTSVLPTAGGSATSADAGAAGAGSGGFTPRDGGTGAQRRPPPGRHDSDDDTPARTRWLRAGIDITA
jgi:hypothetical protein